MYIVSYVSAVWALGVSSSMNTFEEKKHELSHSVRSRKTASAILLLCCTGPPLEWSDQSFQPHCCYWFLSEIILQDRDAEVSESHFFNLETWMSISLIQSRWSRRDREFMTLNLRLRDESEKNSPPISGMEARSRFIIFNLRHRGVNKNSFDLISVFETRTRILKVAILPKIRSSPIFIFLDLKSHSHSQEKVQFFETRLRIIFLALTWRGETRLRLSYDHYRILRREGDYILLLSCFETGSRLKKIISCGRARKNEADSRWEFSLTTAKT